ncbi:hypothetical protein CTM97_19175 [Photobacterium phosphoreum]|uniref:Lysozyme inhibitor LprI-like N-terminal domain-containing protein n=2 Tax=Photobacterium phosphoreum TaxID=659 RepID=A0A2T3JYL5_PHOPO|nr:hypothetical protein CTM96_00750 [Photobacterium phosphoreum]PSU38404.1 hypothetical protein CTM97_19175 [Photobacterium phosphoreum]PSU54488.1 hypothetical protein C9J18_02860 [Photobacterium phosphoreum]
MISVLLVPSLAMAITPATKINCDDAYTTLEINQCAADKFDAANQQLQVYLTKSIQQNSTDKALVDAIQTAQKQWLQYREAECNAVYTQWQQGTIRGVMTLSCKLALTQQRTLMVWENYLRPMDSSEAALPKPVVDAG